MGNREGKKVSLTNPQVAKDEKLKFSFEFYDKTGKYCLSEFEKGQVQLVMERLQQMNEKTLPDLIRDKKTLHFHEVYWDETIEKKGFPCKWANLYDPFQFSLNGVNNQKARVYGAFAGGVFYIVWFDLEHKIWPSPKKHT
jgi:hypothetical protein